MIRILSILVVLVFISGCRTEDRSPQKTSAIADSRRPWKLVCLGGSNTIGIGIKPEEAYPAKLQMLLEEEGWPVKVVNAGISGETFSGASMRLSWILQQRIDAFLFALGEETSDQNLPPEELRLVWDEILTKLRNAYPSIPVFILLMQQDISSHQMAVWKEIQEREGIALLVPDWSDMQQKNQAIRDGFTPEGQQALAQWLKLQTEHLPEAYYLQDHN